MKTVLRLAGEREELRIVDDQRGTPTWTRDLAGAMWALMCARREGVFHYSNEGQASWYEFACTIVEEARMRGFPLRVQAIVPITSDEYAAPAKRPACSVLSMARIRPLLSGPIPNWRESLGLMLEELKQCRDC